jgi:hypothetical protein
VNTDIVVFDFEEPRQKLMSWFLTDSGIANVRVVTLDDAREALLTRPRVLVVNSMAEPEAIAQIVRELRSVEGCADLRVIVLHDGKHAGRVHVIDADICMHDVQDVDALVEVVVAALRDEIPDAEPHEAAEEVTGEGQPAAG